MNQSKEAKSLTLWRGSEVSQVHTYIHTYIHTYMGHFACNVVPLDSETGIRLGDFVSHTGLFSSLVIPFLLAIG